MQISAMTAGMDRIVRSPNSLPVYLNLQSDSEFGQNDFFMQAVNSIEVIQYVYATPIETRISNK